MRKFLQEEIEDAIDAGNSLRLRVTTLRTAYVMASVVTTENNLSKATDEVNLWQIALLYRSNS